MRRLTLAMALLLVLAAAVAGCGDEDSPTVDVGSGGDADQPVSTDVDPGTTAPFDPATGARPAEPRGGLDDPRPTTIEGLTVVDDQTLQVRFYNGVDACYGVDRVEVAETPDSVGVAVFTGGLPEARGMVCIEIAELRSVTVTLEAPLGARTVVDASTGAPVPLA